MKPDAPRIVIAGGGFAGLYAALYLARSELAERGATVTLLDRKNYFTFTPLLAEVAAGTLGTEHVTYPFRVLAARHGFAYRQEEVARIDPGERCVHTASGRIPYDYLVVAVGSAPQYFGNREVETAALPFTTVDDARRLRARVIGLMEEAIRDPDGARARGDLTFVVAGAGPAGVEVASEIRRLVCDTLRPYYPGLPEPRVVLAHGGDRILLGWDAELACAAQETLVEMGVDLRLETLVTGARDGVVRLKGPAGEDRVRSPTLVWTAGTALPGWLAESARIPVTRRGVEVLPTLQVRGDERIFAIGDAAHLEDPRAGHPYPAVAPIAISQGIRAAGNVENHALGRPLEDYHAHHAGKIVSLGGGVALVDLLGYRVTGRLGWWIYRAAYLAKLVGVENKIRVLFTLAMNHFFPPDISSAGLATRAQGADAGDGQPGAAAAARANE